MSKSVAEILRKPKSTDKKEDSDDKKDSKKMPKANALLSFIAKVKKGGK